MGAGKHATGNTHTTLHRTACWHTIPLCTGQQLAHNPALHRTACDYIPKSTYLQISTYLSSYLSIYHLSIVSVYVLYPCTCKFGYRSWNTQLKLYALASLEHLCCTQTETVITWSSLSLCGDSLHGSLLLKKLYIHPWNVFVLHKWKLKKWSSLSLCSKSMCCYQQHSLS